MLRYIGKRMLLTLPTLFLVSLIVFTLIRLVPGDPAQVLLGEDADKESIAAARTTLGGYFSPRHIVVLYRNNKQNVQSTIVVIIWVRFLVRPYRKTRFEKED